VNNESLTGQHNLPEKEGTMKKQLILFAAVILVASSAFAGMGGMGGNGMPGRPGNNNGGVGAGMGPAGGANLVVADDGTVLTIKRTPGDPEVPGSGTIELIAVAPTGGVLWSWTAPAAIHVLDIAGNTVLVSSIDADAVMTPGVPGSGQGHASVLYALALASGAELWTLEFEGHVMSLESAPDVIYAVVADHDAVEGTGIVPRGGAHGPGPGMGAGEITLYAISYQGVVSWTVALN
jgi:hypothetical protein